MVWRECRGRFVVIGKEMWIVRCIILVLCFLMIRRPPRSTQCRSSAASDVYKRQKEEIIVYLTNRKIKKFLPYMLLLPALILVFALYLSLIHISEPTRPY